jgi:hypothetical protein
MGASDRKRAELALQNIQEALDFGEIAQYFSSEQLLRFNFRCRGGCKELPSGGVLHSVWCGVVLCGVVWCC